MENEESRVDRLEGDFQNLDLKTLLAALEKRALAEPEGQLTILRSSAGWRVSLRMLDPSYRQDIEALKPYPTLYQAILEELAHGR